MDIGTLRAFTAVYEGNNYLVGTATSSCVTFGMLAGEAIAKMEPMQID